MPVLLGVLDARHGARSDLKRVCIEDAECAALVSDILNVLAAGGETQDVSPYLRKDERPRKPRRPNSVHVIVNQRALPEGAPLRLSALWQRESLFDEQGLLRVRGMAVEG